MDKSLEELRDEFINDFCCSDSHGEWCDSDCDACEAFISDKLSKLENAIRADARRKFAEWLANGNTFIRRIGTDKLTTIDEVISEYEKEQKEGAT